MKSSHYTLDISAARETVWRTLTTLDSVAEYSPSVRRARYTSDVRHGIGASRHCLLRPSGESEERVVACDPGHSLTLETYDGNGFASLGTTRFDLIEIGPEVTSVTQTTQLRNHGGLIGRLLSPRDLTREPRANLTALKKYIEGGGQ